MSGVNSRRINFIRSQDQARRINKLNLITKDIGLLTSILSQYNHYVKLINSIVKSNNIDSFKKHIVTVKSWWFGTFNLYRKYCENIEGNQRLISKMNINHEKEKLDVLLVELDVLKRRIMAAENGENSLKKYVYYKGDFTDLQTFSKNKLEEI